MSDGPHDGTPRDAWWAERDGGQQPSAEDNADTPSWMPRAGESAAGESAEAPPLPAASVLPGRPMTGPRERPSARPLPAPRRRRRVGRILAWSACVMSALILVASVGGYLIINNFVAGIHKIDGVITDSKGSTVAAKGSENYLLVGSDGRDGLSRAERSRLKTGFADYGKHSDTMILAHVSHTGSRAVLVSLPRDTLVEVPEFTDDKGKLHREHRSKLNAAYSLGGPALAVRTIERATGVHIDHYIEVDFTGFLKMVDAVGGVDVCIPESVARKLPDKDSGLDLPAGTSHIKGAQALAYVRARHIYPSQDLGRIQAQQKFIGAMVRQTLSAGTLANPLRIKHLLDAVGKSLQTDSGFSTKNLVTLATNLRNFSPRHVTFATVPVADASYSVSGLGSTVLWDVPAAKALFGKINRDEDVDDSRDDTTLKPSQVTVQVLNGGGVAGVGSRTKSELIASGFQSAGPAKTAGQPADRTTIRYSGEDAAAKALLKAVPDAQLQQVDGLGATVELVIGKDFTGTTHLTPTPSTGKTPTTRSAADTSCT